MTEYRSVLERASASAPTPDLPLERVLRRRDRKRRDQRIRAGVVGIAVAIAVGWVGVNEIRSTSPVPGDEAPPTPAPSPNWEVFPPSGVDWENVPPTDIDWAAVPGMSVDGDAIVDVRTGEVTPLPASITSFRDPGGYAVAPGGAVLFFEASPDGSKREQIFVANVDGTNLRQLTDAPQGADAGGWSPDGTTIVARIWGPEGPGMDGGQVVLIDVATGETTLLADGPDLDFFEPHFDADGQQVLFSRYGRENYEVFGVPVDGGEVGLVFEDRWDPIFSPDGRTILYEVYAPIMNFNGRTGNSGQELWLADADGSDPRPLVWEEAFNARPSWSPDGTRIAYTRSRFDEVDERVVIVDVPSGEPTFSVLSPGSEGSAVWLDDHRLIVDVIA